uniref:Ig-like domain-containing protein n=1 Tax=Astyanax mexicanus TaxID=7994 RepID=A0A8B9JEQ4_ASTMX
METKHQNLNLSFISLGQPKAVLTIYPANQVFRGESVTLVCDIQGGGGSEWTYHWYNSGNTFYSYSTTEQCKLSSVSESDSGEYTCRGKVEGSTQYSDTSTAVKLTVSALPRATLTVDPGSTVFIRESVTLKCEITGYDGWRYQWFKGSSRTAVSQSQRNTFTFIGSAADQDQYWCRGLRYYTRPISSQDSNKITLTVRGEFTDLTLSMYNENYSGECMVKFKKINILFGRTLNLARRSCSEILFSIKYCFFSTEVPNAVVSINPDNQVFRGETVILRCDLQEGGGTEWRYNWYKNGNTVYSDITSQEIRLSSVSESDSGEYACIGKIAGTQRYSHYSSAVILTVSVTTPSVTLIVSPSRSQHFTTDFLSLICEGQSDSTGWRVRRYSLSESKVSDCSSGWGSVTGSTCNISSLSTNDTGVYWCESESEGNSNPVNITVHYVILVSPVHPLTEGDPLTLHCLFLYTKPLDLTADFYKDGLLLQTQTTGEMTIPTVSKSDEGLYHCTILQIGESPQSWISVREAPFSVLRLLSSLMAASPYLLLTIILVVKCYKSQGKKSLNKIKYPGWPQVLKKS